MSPKSRTPPATHNRNVDSDRADILALQDPGKGSAGNQMCLLSIFGTSIHTWDGKDQGGADVCVFLRVSYSYGNASPVLFGISRRKYYIFTTYSNPLWGKFMEAPGKLLLRSCSLGLAYGLH